MMPPYGKRLGAWVVAALASVGLAFVVASVILAVAYMTPVRSQELLGAGVGIFTFAVLWPGLLMKRQLFTRRLVFLLSAFIGVGSAVRVANAATAPPIKLPKKQIRVIRTECLVVATEAKRVAQTMTVPQAHAKELWARISENNNTAGAMFFLRIDFNRDVLGNGPAPSGLGWRPEFLDTTVPSSNQRHHYAFYYFIGATESITAELGTIINTYNDAISDNIGDLTLRSAAIDFGTFSRINGVTPDIGNRHMKRFCQ